MTAGGAKSAATKWLEKGNRPPPGQPFIWLTQEMLESPAWCALSSPGRNVIFRMTIEHMAHAGKENGRLAVTYSDIRRYGVSGKHVAYAIREAVALGFITVTRVGRAGNREFKEPSRYALSWLPMRDGTTADNRWRLVQSREHARQLIESIPKPQRGRKACPFPTRRKTKSRAPRVVPFRAPRVA